MGANYCVWTGDGDPRSFLYACVGLEILLVALFSELWQDHCLNRRYLLSCLIKFERPAESRFERPQTLKSQGARRQKGMGGPPGVSRRGEVGATLALRGASFALSARA